jgi:hypothetical protein
MIPSEVDFDGKGNAEKGLAKLGGVGPGLNLFVGRRRRVFRLGCVLWRSPDYGDQFALVGNETAFRARGGAHERRQVRFGLSDPLLDTNSCTELRVWPAEQGRCGAAGVRPLNRRHSRRAGDRRWAIPCRVGLARRPRGVTTVAAGRRPFAVSGEQRGAAPVGSAKERGDQNGCSRCSRTADRSIVQRVRWSSR